GEDINIVQAKKLTEEGEKIILADIPREKAENIKKQLEDKGVQALPGRDFAHEQKLSYSQFLTERLPRLLNFYFPAEFSDYNNHIRVNITDFKCQEPEISEQEAQENYLTWNHTVSFNWKSFSPAELKALLTQTHQQLQALSDHDHQEKKGLVEKLTKKIQSLEQGETKNPQAIELKFLNSGTVVSLLDVLKTFMVPAELVEKLFGEELNREDYPTTQPLEVGVSLPHFLFTKKNSYFDIGKLGRKKYNQKVSIISQVENQELAEDLLDNQGKLILKKSAQLTGKNLQILAQALEKNKIPSLMIPHSTNDLYVIKIKSPRHPEKISTIVGIGTEISEEKTYFDLADLISLVANYINLYQGLGKVKKEEDKDQLENQVIRRVGDLVYNIFDNKLGGFLQGLDNKYLASISQLKKVDLLKLPNLKDFDNLIKHFFNTSALVQLQNQNNPLSEASYTRKLSVLGLGGFSSANTTMAARNVNSSYYGRYDLVETPEGQRVGLVHNLTIGAEINDYGQVVVPYYRVHQGIDEKNQIEEETVLTRYRGDFVRVPKEKVDYIDSSFYQLNSITSSTIPFFHHNDATRMLMASNMQRQAVTLSKSQVPLVASGIETSLLNNSPLVIKATAPGQVEYVDRQQVVLGQIMAAGNYANNGELSLGYNLRVAYLCWHGYNYEDAIIISERLVKEDILTSFFVKKHAVIRYNTKYGPEVFTASFPHLEKKRFPHLDKEGIVKVGSEVKSNDILVGKLTPEPGLRQPAAEELLLMSILGEKAQRFVNSSLYLPVGEKGTVYQVKRKKFPKNKNELELVEIYVAQERKIEVGDKLTTRFGNKGVVAKIVPESDMPFDEQGQTIDIIFNPLGIPTRMNIGQLLETVLAAAAHRLNTKLLIRPFNTPNLATIKEILHQAGIKNGSQKLFDGQTGLPFDHDIYNGYIYTIKLNHMVTDKFHARDIGPYSLIYQQPLKGRAQGGGQRVGEMEA
ncbi:6936_t:CDS:2, partial [Ambispora gerdemannii]